MSLQLTPVACAFHHHKCSEMRKPVVQVLSIKAVDPNILVPGQGPRMRVLLSDGVHYVQALLSAQLNPLVESGALAKHAVVQVDEFLSNEFQAKFLVVVLNLTVLGFTQKIGAPESIHHENTKRGVCIDADTGVISNALTLNASEDVKVSNRAELQKSITTKRKALDELDSQTKRQRLALEQEESKLKKIDEGPAHREKRAMRKSLRSLAEQLSTMQLMDTA